MILECDFKGCDRDERDGPLTEWTLATRDGTSDLTLCKEHGTPLEAIWDMGRVKRRPGRKPGKPGGLAEVRAGVLDSPRKDVVHRPAAGQEVPATKKAPAKRPGKKRSLT